MRTIALPIAILAVSAAATVQARPVDPLARSRYTTIEPWTPSRASGIQGAAATDTVYFGGTFWNADSSRWQALEDSTWTFDSGVGSHFNHAAAGYPGKDPSLHALMEGWVGVDNTQNTDSTFRRRLASEFTGGPATCVGAAAGLGGSASLWAGLTQTEAVAASYVAGQGYGNDWTAHIEREFTHPGGAGTVTLEYDYAVNAEPGFDYATVLVDTSGNGDMVEVASYTGVASGHASVLLTPGVNLRTDAGPFRVQFRATSDPSYSDEDGWYATTCGEFAVDGVELSGLVSEGPFTFEAGDEGWGTIPVSPVDMSDIVDLSDLPDETPECPCSLRDSVLVFAHSLTTLPEGVDNVAVSPWIDLKAAGQVGKAGKVVQFDMLGVLGAGGPTLLELQVQWYPYLDPVSGLVRVSDPETMFFGGRGKAPVCNSRARVDLSGVVPPEAEQVRIAFGVLGACFYSPAECLTQPPSSTPWLDNIRFGVFAQPDPAVVLNGGLLQDVFPADGTLNLTSTARVDAPESPWYAPMDTFTVTVAGSGVEAQVLFAVHGGQGIDAVRLNQWLGSHPTAVTWQGLDWHYARLDTAESHGSLSLPRWMTTYHEDDPHFTGTDTALDPDDPGHLLNDIFPDDLLTPGSRLCMFFRARRDGGPWSVGPDTAGGRYLEIEVLPSSLRQNGDQNCVLYINATRTRNYDGIEPALAALYPAPSANFESTAWDRLDVLKPTLFPPVAQLAGYRTIILSTGILLWNLVNPVNGNVPDEVRLTHWLEDDPSGGKGLYLTGDNGVDSWNDGPFNVMEEYLGISGFCYSVRVGQCNGLGVNNTENAYCLGLPAAADPHFTPASPLSVSGNGCTEFRFMDRLDLGAPTQGTAKANLSYTGPNMGTQDYASITHEVTSGGMVTYRTVTDGASLHLWNAGCGGASAIQTRLGDVLTWLGLPPGAGCAGEPLGVPGEDPIAPRPARLLLTSRHPVTGSAAMFRVEDAGGTRVRVDIYDVSGRLVRRLLDEDRVTDRDLVWNLDDDAGRRVSPGMYFVKASGGVQATRRVVIMP